MKNKENSKRNKASYSSHTIVKSSSYAKLALVYGITKMVLFFKGVRTKYINRLEGEMETPSIVLCNHGAFIDFMYAGVMIKKKTPNVIVARYYFYHKLLGNLLRSIGCFPKSMFAQDLDSAMNCMRVLRRGGVLAMMPEARLSTIGEFEDIQESTFKFLKHASVPVYYIKICGDYLASPKWGDGLRRGAVVETTLDLLFTKEEIETLDIDQIKERTLEKLYYNEMEFLASRPDIRYRKRTLAKGLENILTICPKCKRKYTIYTKNRTVGCTECGELARLDDRYLFNEGAPFASFVDWYKWQREVIAEEIRSNPDYILSSSVEYKLPSDDGKTFLRHAGYGTCTLSREGLVYEGTRDGENVTLHFPISEIYRLLFGAGVNFEVYVKQIIHFFVPKVKSSSVDWYIASSIIYDEVVDKKDR